MKRTLLLLLVLAAACTMKAGGDQIEKKIVQLLSTDGLVVSKAKCPKAIEVKVDAKFTCEATFDNGESFVVEGVVTSKKGSEFEYNVHLPQPNYVAAKLEKMVFDGIAAQTAAPQSVTCGKPGIHHPPADGKLPCTVVAAAGESVNVVIAFTPEGTVDRWDPVP